MYVVVWHQSIKTIRVGIVWYHLLAKLIWPSKSLGWTDVAFAASNQAVLLISIVRFVAVGRC